MAKKSETQKKTISDDVPMTLERAAVLLKRLQEQLSLTNIAAHDLERRVISLEDDSHEH